MEKEKMENRLLEIMSQSERVRAKVVSLGNPVLCGRARLDETNQALEILDEVDIIIGEAVKALNRGVEDLEEDSEE